MFDKKTQEAMNRIVIEVNAKFAEVDQKLQLLDDRLHDLSKLVSEMEPKKTTRGGAKAA